MQNEQIPMIRQNRIIIDLDAIRENYLLVKKLVGEKVSVMPVIKADAYGHGMLPVANILSELGAKHFAVALPEEGIRLRQAGIEGEILVLGAATPRSTDACVRYNLTQTVFTPEQLSEIARGAASLGKKATVHIKLDTGMNRIGLKTETEATEMASLLKQYSTTVDATGIYTHFCDADTPTPEAEAFTASQLKRFNELKKFFPDTIPAHAANSAMILLAPEARFDLVREGISLYGYPPVKTDLPFRPALRWVTEITHVKTVRAGETIGYGRAFTAPRDLKIATAAVGYGDGYLRAACGGEMLVRGKRVPIVGRICMDQTMIDVSSLPKVVPGDEVVLIGSQGDEFIGAEEIAENAGTICYEVLCSPTGRVPRVFTEEFV